MSNQENESAVSEKIENVTMTGTEKVGHAFKVGLFAIGMTILLSGITFGITQMATLTPFDFIKLIFRI